jgi:hypothetical protein
MFVHHLQTQRQQREAAHQLAARTAGAKLTIDHARQRHALAIQCRRALDLHRIEALKARHELARQRTEEMHAIEVRMRVCLNASPEGQRAAQESVGEAGSAEGAARSDAEARGGAAAQAARVRGQEEDEGLQLAAEGVCHTVYVRVRDSVNSWQHRKRRRISRKPISANLRATSKPNLCVRECVCCVTMTPIRVCRAILLRPRRSHRRRR